MLNLISKITLFLQKIYIYMISLSNLWCSNKFKQQNLLFIIKERKAYNTKTKAYGLYNSCEFVARKMREEGHIANTVQVIDNNCIDKYVSLYKPTHCFIEALWVVPSKFEVLAKLHPKVKWIIRLHSMVPFLTSEGMAFEWLNEYMELRKKGIDISISCNNDKAYEDLKEIYKNNISYTPNIYYPDHYIEKTINFNIPQNDKEINIGCFGALRVLKNHSQQAIWAIEFANEIGKTLNFHINISEHEQKEAGPILRNLRAIFKNTKHKLVEHPWYNHTDFLGLVKKMDIGLQVSFTETFNITAADFVYLNIPIVVSTEIDFVQEQYRVNPTNKEEFLHALERAYYGAMHGAQYDNFKLLRNHNHKSTKTWLKLLQK